MTTIILSEIKRMLGVQEDCSEFDTEIIADINAVILALHQLGFGKDGFTILSGSETWGDFVLDTESGYLSYIKQYVFLRTKTVFDASASSAVSEAITNTIAELEWRLLLEKEDKVGENQNGA